MLNERSVTVLINLVVILYVVVKAKKLSGTFTFLKLTCA